MVGLISDWQYYRYPEGVHGEVFPNGFTYYSGHMRIMKVTRANVLSLIGDVAA
jgi:hypothetical protein